MARAFTLLDLGVSNDLQKNPRLSRVPRLRTPRARSTCASYTGALLAALSVGSSAVCTLRTVLHSPGAFFRADDVAALGRCGHRQISTVTQFQAHPSGFLHWARGPCSRAAGGSLLTGAILKARTAGGLSDSFGRSVLKPKLLAGLLSFVPSPTLLHKFQVIYNFPNFQNTTAPYRCPHSLQK